MTDLSSSSPVIERARVFACERMAHLFRKNKSKQPYAEHLAEVAALAESAGCSENAVAAAWLHDVVEDTPTTIEDIRAHFGEAIARLVDGLTDPEDFAALPLHIRKPKQAERLKSHSDSELLKVKLCDQISNVRCVFSDPPVEDWSDEKSVDYIRGAKTIADVCLGQSALLDKLFADIHDRAVEKYSLVSF